MDYPTLIAKYLGVRNSEQLANDVKNLTAFEAKGGNLEKLLKATRAKIFSDSKNKISQQRDNLQQSMAAGNYLEVETPAALAAKNAAAELAQFETRLGVPQMKSAYEQEAQRLSQVKMEQATAPSLLLKEMRTQPRLGASVADMVKEFSDPSSPSFIPSSAAIFQAVGNRVNAQRATLGDALKAVESVYKQMAEEQKTATESRKELLQDAQKNALGLYKDFTDLQQQLDKEARALVDYETRRKIDAKYRASAATPENPYDFTRDEKNTITAYNMQNVSPKVQNVFMNVLNKTQRDQFLRDYGRAQEEAQQSLDPEKYFSQWFERKLEEESLGDDTDSLIERMSAGQ